MGAGESLSALGPLGNGFPLEAAKGKKVFLMGGGIGIPPMLQVAKELDADKSVILGYRDELFLNQEFAPYGEVYLATEDGSAGSRGNVMDAIREHALTADVIFACGPKPMLRAIKNYALETGCECWISMEERMACGIGACLGCVCQSTEVDGHSHVHNKRVCKDGPVFLCTEVEL
jgi:dihydroorotate dehydrogenase electron transfer subunit